MSSISFLDSTNFVLIGTQNKSLGINLPGPVLVFFKMQQSDPCREFEPTFLKLSNMEPRTSYAILDVTHNKDVVLWSRKTSTPITGVPVLILYMNGKPHAKFNGTKNIPSLQNFITQALQTIPPGGGQKSFMNSQAGRGQSNMYGSGPPGPPSSSQDGHRYQSMGGQGQYPAVPGQPTKNMPDIGRAPSMKGVLKGGAGSGYAVGGNYVEDDDDARLMIPDTVTPWNAPWEAGDSQQNY